MDELPKSFQFAYKHPYQAALRAACAFALALSISFFFLEQHYTKSDEDTHPEYEQTKEDTDAPLALYTLWLTFFTSVLAFSTIGLWLTTRKGMRDQARDMQLSLSYARTSSNAAVDAAKAAAEALSIERAWICFSHQTSMYATNSTDLAGVTHKETVGLVINFINTGRSPASNIRLAYDMKLIPFARRLIPTFDIEYDLSQSSFVIGPNQIVSTQPAWIFGDDYERFVQRQIKAILYAKAQYLSVTHLTETFEIEVCIAVDCNGSKDDLDGQGTSLNLVTVPVGQQNRHS